MRSESLATRHVLIMAGNYYVVFQLSNKTPPPPRNTHSPTPSHNFGPTASSFQYAQPLACIHLVNKPFGWRSLALGPLQYFSIKGTTWLSNILWVCSREKPESWKIAPYIISITLPVNWTPLCQSLHLFFFSFFFFLFFTNDDQNSHGWQQHYPNSEYLLVHLLKGQHPPEPLHHA